MLKSNEVDPVSVEQTPTGPVVIVKGGPFGAFATRRLTSEQLLEQEAYSGETPGLRAAVALNDPPKESHGRASGQ